MLRTAETKSVRLACSRPIASSTGVGWVPHARCQAWRHLDRVAERSASCAGVVLPVV